MQGAGKGVEAAAGKVSLEGPPCMSEGGSSSHLSAVQITAPIEAGGLQASAIPAQGLHATHPALHASWGGVTRGCPNHPHHVVMLIFQSITSGRGVGIAVRFGWRPRALHGVAMLVRISELLQLLQPTAQPNAAS